jgi:hypothetical protein|tara:strand:- start:1660 stop:1875 length:216 start_codon:yes stop_codon:yes gene_type:complete
VLGVRKHINGDLGRMDAQLRHRYVAEELQWAKGVSLSTVEKSMNRSLCFADYVASEQIALARVISDFASST